MENGEQSAIADFFNILEEHRKNCEQEGKYVEAEIAKNRLEELKTHEDNRQKESMRARQIADKLGIEEAHKLEFEQFEGSWKKKIDDYEGHSEKSIQNMTGRHLNDFQDFRGKLLKKQQKPKFSSDLLTMRKVEEHLVRSEKYAEAQKTKEKADERERIETEKWVEQKRKEMDRNEVLFKKGKQQELTALQKRLQAGREDLKKQKKIALERLLQRYQNVKNELEAQHMLERINRDKHKKRGVHIIIAKKAKRENAKKK